MKEWRNEESLFTQMYVNAQGRNYTLKRNTYKNIYSCSSLNICICLSTAWITDGSHWWQTGIMFIRHLDPKIVLPHGCLILRLVNKAPPQSTRSDHSIGPNNSPELCIERRMLASHSNVVICLWISITSNERIYIHVILEILKCSLPSFKN